MKIAVQVVGIVGLVIVGEAAADSPQWSVTPPPGWSEAPAEQLAFAELQERWGAGPLNGGRIMASKYQSAEGDVLAIVFVRSPVEGKEAMQAARGFEKGAHDASAKLGPDSSYTTREENNTLIGEQVIAAAGGTVRFRRMAGVNDSDMLSITGICKGPEAVCGAALQSLSLDTTGFRSLDARDADEKSSAYRAGYTFGKYFIPAILVGWLLRRLLRKRDKQSA